MVHRDRLGDLVTDPMHRIQRGERILEHHRDPVRRAPVAAADRNGRRGSHRRRLTSPLTLAVGGSSPRIASDVTDLPEPDSPTIPRVSARVKVEADVVDGVHDPVVGLELDRQVADRQHGFGHRQCRDLRVEGVAERVAEEVHGEHREQEHQAREKHEVELRRGGRVAARRPAA